MTYATAPVVMQASVLLDKRNDDQRLHLSPWGKLAQETMFKHGHAAKKANERGDKEAAKTIIKTMVKEVQRIYASAGMKVRPKIVGDKLTFEVVK
jgi:hypothetical protein